LGFDPGAAVIHEVFTPPDFRGRKLQAFMMRHIVEDLDARGVAGRVYAEVRPDNIPSLKGFARAGFDRIARVRGIKLAGIVFRGRVLP
jgi:ribosomal protein S18 acetylase RimI-like enzyme